MTQTTDTTGTIATTESGALLPCSLQTDTAALHEQMYQLLARTFAP